MPFWCIDYLNTSVLKYFTKYQSKIYSISQFQIYSLISSWSSPVYEDNEAGDTENCAFFSPRQPERSVWVEMFCNGRNAGFDFTFGCLCEYQTQPLIHIRGFCPYSRIEHMRFTIVQSVMNPNEIIMVGRQSAQIRYNFELNQWIFSDHRLNVTAR